MSDFCNPMGCSTLGSSLLHYLLEFAQSPSLELVLLSNHLILFHPLLLCLQSFPTSESFPMSQLFPSGGPNIRASALASVLPMMNIQSWFPLALTAFIKPSGSSIIANLVFLVQNSIDPSVQRWQGQNQAHHRSDSIWVVISKGNEQSNIDLVHQLWTHMPRT